MEIKRWLRTQWDRAGAVAIAVAAVVALGLGWAGVSRVSLATQQIPYLASGGLFGIFLLGVAGTLWLSADLRDQWRKLDSMHDELRKQTEVLEEQNDIARRQLENAAPRNGAPTAKPARTARRSQ